MATSEASKAGGGIEARLAYRLVDDHPIEAARLLDSLDPIQAVEILQASAPTAAAAVLAALKRGHAARCLAAWPAEQRPQVIAALGAAPTSRLLRCLSPSERQEILAACPEDLALPIRKLTRYPLGSAGALMDADPPLALKDATVGEARALLARASGRTRGYLYVVTDQQVLAGVVEVHDLLSAAPESPLWPLATPASARIAARAEGSAVALHPGWRMRHVLPVVDSNDVLVGAIDHRTLHELGGAPIGDDADTPLGLAVGELYWTLMSGLVEGIVRTLKPATPKPAAPGPEVAR